MSIRMELNRLAQEQGLIIEETSKGDVIVQTESARELGRVIHDSYQYTIYPKVTNTLPRSVRYMLIGLIMDLADEPQKARLNLSEPRYPVNFLEEDTGTFETTYLLRSWDSSYGEQFRTGDWNSDYVDIYGFQSEFTPSGLKEIFAMSTFTMTDFSKSIYRLELKQDNTKVVRVRDCHED